MEDMKPHKTKRINIRKEDRNYNHYRLIQEHEVKEVLTKMSNDKTVGRDNILIEVWKSLRGRGIVWHTKRFNKIIRTKKMMDESRISTLNPIYNNKGVCKILSVIGELSLLVMP